jgi:hypothetical protein
MTKLEMINSCFNDIECFLIDINLNDFIVLMKLNVF